MPSRSKPKRIPFSITVGGETVSAGEHRTITLPVAGSYAHNPMEIPVHVIVGRRPGPRLFVCAAIHGDELNGVEIVRRLIARPSWTGLRGALVLVPVVNLPGLLACSRYLPDRRDLNRCFPGHTTGSLASRLAKLFIGEIVKPCTHGIDLHTGSNHRFNLPQIRACLAHEETAEMARAFGAPVIIDANLRDGSLRQAVLEQGKPMLVYEAGEALRLDEHSVRAGERGVTQVLRWLEMLPRRRIPRPPQEPFVVTSSGWLRAPQSGLFQPGRELGGVVDRGETIAHVSDLTGARVEPVVAHHAGVIIGLNRLPLVNEGDALYHVARLEGSEGSPEVLPEDVFGVGGPTWGGIE